MARDKWTDDAIKRLQKVARAVDKLEGLPDSDKHALIAGKLGSGTFHPTPEECASKLEELKKPPAAAPALAPGWAPELMAKFDTLLASIQTLVESDHEAATEGYDALIEELAKLRSVVSAEGTKTRETLSDIGTGIEMMNDQMASLLKGLNQDLEDSGEAKVAASG